MSVHRYAYRPKKPTPAEKAVAVAVFVVILALALASGAAVFWALGYGAIWCANQVFGPRVPLTPVSGAAAGGLLFLAAWLTKRQ